MVAPRQQAAAGARVSHQWCVVGVPFLDHGVSVVNEMDLICLHPGSARPSKVLFNPPPELAVVGELILPRIGRGDADEFVFVVVVEYLCANDQFMRLI